MTVERIDHIHILVKDLEGAMEFFSSIMGTKFIGPLDRRPQRQFRCAFDTMGLELLSPTSPEHWLSSVMEKEGEGLFSIGLKVTDIDETVAELEAKGLKLTRRGESPDIKFAVFYPEGAYGVRIELVQYDGMTPIGVANARKMSELPWFKS